jgi:hypothetical protein
MGRFQIDLHLRLRGADVAGDVEVVALRLDSIHRDALRVVVFFIPVLVGVDDLVDVLVEKDVLALAFLEVLGCVDEQLLAAARFRA